MKPINNPLSALKHKNFRYYWISMCFSTTGTWMQSVAQPWLVYQLTGSPFLLSLTSALQFVPVLLFSLFAGVLIDRLPKKKLLIFTQSASLIITLILALLTWTGRVQFWHILVTSTALGFINTLDMPARQSFFSELTGKDDLMNAIALNSVVFNLSRVFGPALAGIVISYWGVAVCFLANSISFSAVLIGLFFIKPMVTLTPPAVNEGIIENIKQGLKYIYKNDILLTSLLLIAATSTFAQNFSILVPVFSVDILHQQETGFGLLMSLIGVGAFLGNMLVAVFSSSGPRKFILYIVPLFVAFLLIVTSYTDTFILTGIALTATGFFLYMFITSANSALQLNSTTEYRGRVMSVFSLIYAGSTPIGNIYAGAFAEHFNARAGFAACGAAIFVLMLLMYIRLIKKRRSKAGLA